MYEATWRCDSSLQKQTREGEESPRLGKAFLLGRLGVLSTNKFKFTGSNRSSRSKLTLFLE